MRAMVGRSSRSRGATLAEGVMVFVVGGLLLSVLPGYYLTYVKLWQRETGKLGATQRAEFALLRMKDDVRNARRATLSADGTSVTLTLPNRAYDSSLGRDVNVLDGSGMLADGDRVRYYFTQDTSGTESGGGTLSRQVTRANGTELAPRPVAAGVHPELNPWVAGGSSAVPVFAYDATSRVITATVTSADPFPSSSTFSAEGVEPRCKRCGGELARVVTEENPEGAVQCPECGPEAQATAEVVTHQIRLLLRNE